ncbi:MAG: type I secretion C-terminal target domain-containing protein [Alphaproteobacteria bacterium]|nr:type I secretion C-terminal target domain-containing protein [Alphaproteobacteria bacterium]
MGIKISAPQTGAYVGYYRFNDEILDTESFVSTTGNNPAIAFAFHDWTAGGISSNFQTFSALMEDSTHTVLDMASILSDQGTVLALAWAIPTPDYTQAGTYTGDITSAVPLDDIINGAYDDFIRTSAREIRDLGVPVMISPFGEANVHAYFAFGENGGTAMSAVEDRIGKYGDPNVSDGAERVNDVYKHVVDIFNEEGADNVTWFMYTSTGFANPDLNDVDEIEMTKLQDLYPGDEYVDWVGQSAYFIDTDYAQIMAEVTNPLSGGHLEDTLSFADTLINGYNAWHEVSSNPFFIPEFGMQSVLDIDRGSLIAEVFGDALPNLFPDVKAVTIADSTLIDAFYNIPKLGTVAGDEALKAYVGDNAYYHDTVLFYDPAGGGDVATDDTVCAPDITDAYPVVEDPVAVDPVLVSDEVPTEQDFVYNFSTIKGTCKGELLWGDDGDNLIFGRGGDDILYGGRGTDVLKGGCGADIFFFDVDSLGSVDAIEDFKSFQGDMISVEEILHQSHEYDAILNNLNDYVQVVCDDTNTYIGIDIDGSAGVQEIQYIAVVGNHTDLGTAVDMVAAGLLIV